MHVYIYICVYVKLEGDQVHGRREMGGEEGNGLLWYKSRMGHIWEEELAKGGVGEDRKGVWRTGQPRAKYKAFIYEKFHHETHTSYFNLRH